MTGKIHWSVVEERLYSEKGRPRIPNCLVADPHHLKHTFNDSIETVEPMTGRMEDNGYLARNFLKSVASDAMNALLCGDSSLTYRADFDLCRRKTNQQSASRFHNGARDTARVAFDQTLRGTNSDGVKQCFRASERQTYPAPATPV
ncbi:hypothetical protein [Nitrosomonas sp. Nm33]|uniref:hypothetical protein n=1 Tax=Nitrosomonas sp. Nm33 TaxID=133724 RepID=UPI00115F9B3C|nr:hypothetical protein [Nitrosomonas sp. Nm33]